MNRNNEQPEEGKLLGSIEKREFHAAPEGYFEGFAESMMDRIRTGSNLYAIEKKELTQDPGAVYHQAFEERMMSALGRGQEKTATVVSMQARFFRWTAVAATLALLFTVGYRVINNTTLPEKHASGTYADASNAGLTHEDCQHYLEDELNMDDAIAYYSEHSSTATSAETSAEVDYLMSEEDLELYQY